MSDTAVKNSVLYSCVSRVVKNMWRHRRKRAPHTRKMGGYGCDHEMAEPLLSEEKESVSPHQHKSKCTRKHRILKSLFQCFIKIFKRGKGISPTPPRKRSLELTTDRYTESDFTCPSHQDVRDHSAEPQICYPHCPLGPNSTSYKGITALLLPDIQFCEVSALVIKDKVVLLPNQKEDFLRNTYNHLGRCLSEVISKMRVATATFTIENSSDPIEWCKRILKRMSTNLRVIAETIGIDDLEWLKEKIEKICNHEIPTQWNTSEDDTAGIKCNELMKTQQVLIEQLAIAVRKRNPMFEDLAAHLEASAREVDQLSTLMLLAT